MKKKYIKISIICGFILISGICYSCTFRDKNSSKAIVTSLTDGVNPKEQGSEKQDSEKTDTEANTKIQNAVKDVTNPTEDSFDEGLITGLPENKEQVLKETQAYIHICGAVNNPGVYQVLSGARICDLISRAGGLSKNAAGDYVNQAELVTDGERIYIPTKDEVKELSATEYIEGDQKKQSSTDNNSQDSSGKVENTSELIDINKAGAEELMSLPGVGQAKADSIIEYRTANGKFEKVEDLMKISGIKEGLFNKISSYIIVK